MARERRAKADRTTANELRRRQYAKEAPTYDRGSDLTERWLLGTEHRAWVGSRAVGHTLEVAIGTGLNLPYYPPGIRLTGLDLTPQMMAGARRRAGELGTSLELIEGDAQALPFADGSFDTVVCTYAMCSVPDERETVQEMRRVLRPGGRLILLDHIRSSVRPLFWLQRLWERAPGHLDDDLTRRPREQVEAAGFRIEAADRLRAGVVERLVARKP